MCCQAAARGLDSKGSDVSNKLAWILIVGIFRDKPVQAVRDHDCGSEWAAAPRHQTWWITCR